MRLLVVEDEKDLNDVIVKRLRKANFSVDYCYNGKEALDFIEVIDYDVIILDIMMPELDGLSFLKTIRKKGNRTAELLLTEADSIEDRVAGLYAGANDYLIKPFAYEELIARIHVLTREKSNVSRDVFTVADLVVDCNKRVVTRGGKEIRLKAKEFAVLEYMIRNHGSVLSKETIGNHIWDYDSERDDSIIKVYIRYLRKKIDDDHEVKLIHTVRQYGYVLKAGISDDSYN
jgi:DNA-binding response OmpR family regulator